MEANATPRSERLSPSVERALVERAQTGEKAAFEELVRANAERLYAVLLRFTGDSEESREAMQETFIRAWRSIGRFQGRSAFFTWLYRIGINEAKRRATRRPHRDHEIPIEEMPPSEAPDWSGSPDLRAEGSDALRELAAAIEDLPPEYRMPLVLRDVEGLSTSEAAAAMELGEAAFKSRLHRARMAVRRRMDEYYTAGE